MKDNTREKEKANEKPEIISTDEGEVRNHLDRIVRGTVEETLKTLLDAEANAICQAGATKGPGKA